MKIVGVLQNKEIVYDRYKSHISDKGDIPIEEALSRILVPDGVQFYEAEVTFGDQSGKSNVVEVSSADFVFYAKRPNRRGYSKFVKNRAQEDSNTLVVVLKKRENNDGYILITAFWGNISPSEPFGDDASEDSRKFWNSHAFVDGSVAYDKESIQYETPPEWQFTNVVEKVASTSQPRQEVLPDTVLNELERFIDPKIDHTMMNEYQFIQKQIVSDMTAENSRFLLLDQDSELIEEIVNCVSHSDQQAPVSVKWSNRSMEGYTVYRKGDTTNKHLLDIYCKPPTVAEGKQMLILIRDIEIIDKKLLNDMASCGLVKLAININKIKYLDK